MATTRKTTTAKKAPAKTKVDEELSAKLKERKTRCRICNNEYQAAIEMRVVCAHALSWQEIAKVVNKDFYQQLDGNPLDARTIKNHMENHDLVPSALDTGIILDSMSKNEDGTMRVSLKSLLQSMFVMGAQSIARGDLRPHSIDEFLRVSDALERLQRQEEERDYLDDESVQGFFQTLAALAEAMNSTLPPEMVEKVMHRAKLLGVNIDLAKVKQEVPIEVEAINTDQILEDYEKLGRARTREELINDKVLNGVLE